MAYSLVAVDFISEHSLHAALTRVAAGVASGQLRPLPAVMHSLTATQAALRQMSQARHVGKIVVRSPALQWQNPAHAGTVLITGGLGTLGSQVATWLAAQQVQGLLLLGRTGRWGGASLDIVQGGGLAFVAEVTMAMQDASAAEGMSDLRPHGGSGRTIQGVMHAGGVLADGILSSQTMGCVRTVFGPKVQAAAQLEEAARRQPGTFHVLFSSIAALLGSPGQINYSSANAVLDSMAQAAQSQVRTVGVNIFNL